MQVVKNLRTKVLTEKKVPKVCCDADKKVFSCVERNPKKNEHETTVLLI